MDTTACSNPGIKEIKQNEEKFLYRTRLLDEIHDAIIATDMDFTITYWNKGAEYMFGWTAHQALGQNMNSLMHTELIGISHSEAVCKLLAEKSLEVDAIHTHRDGSRLNVVTKVSVLVDNHGATVGTVGVVRDVTERKRVEDLLWKNKERESFLLKLSDALRPLSDPIEIHRAVTRVTMGQFGSDRCYYCEMIGENAVIRQDARRGGLPSIAGVYPLNNLLILKSLIEVGLPFSVSDIDSAELPDEDLRQLYMQWNVISCLGVPVVKDAKPVGLFCIAQSVPRSWTKSEEELAIEIAERTWAAVERAKAEEALQDSLKREAYLLHLSDTLRLLEDQGAIRSTTINLLADYLKTAQVSINEWDDEANEANPYTVSILRSNKIFSMANAFTSPLLGAEERKHYTDQKVCACIIAPNFLNGRIKTLLSAWQTTPREWTAAEVSLVRETAERLWESLERAVSISIRKQSEELLQKNNEALERSIEMKDEFLSLISHEFRTPLTVIISAIQMLKACSWNELSDKTRGYYNTIRQNSNRQLKLVNNLLDITKVNAGSFQLHTTNSDIIQLTRFIIESIEPYADRKKISVVFVFDPGKIVIGIDEEKYERVLLNLLSNAIKYTPKGKTITVMVRKKIHKKRKMVCVQVSDDGIGIPPDKQEHIFERFGQIENVLSRQAEGTGIGLHLTKMFVEMLGGEIKIDSALGEGSTFTILLPAEKVNETPTEKTMKEMTDNRTIQLTEIEFSDIYFEK